MDSVSFAIGRIKSMESDLVSQDLYAKMTYAKDLQSAFVALSENKTWANFAQKLENAFDIKELVSRAQESLVDLADELCPGSPEVKAQMAIYKGRLTQDEYLQGLENVSLRSSGKLFKKMFFLRQILLRTKQELFDKTRSPEEIIALGQFLPGSSAIIKGADEYAKTGKLQRFEKEADDEITQALMPAKYISFGIDPVVGYLFARQIEIQNVSLILGLKKLGVGADIIKARARRSYA